VALVLVVADAAVLGIRAVVVGGPPVLQKVWWPPGAGPGPVLGLRGAVPRALLKPRAPRRAGASAEERREGGGGGGGGSG
ncbi:unnamed protein product, partial [Prorocentrum cordatum]